MGSWGLGGPVAFANGRGLVVVAVGLLVVAAFVAGFEFAHLDELAVGAVEAAALAGFVAGEMVDVGGAVLHDVAEQVGFVPCGVVGFVDLVVVAPLVIEGGAEESCLQTADALEAPFGDCPESS